MSDEKTTVFDLAKRYGWEFHTRSEPLWEPTTPNSVSYGDMERIGNSEAKLTDWVEPRFLSGSDYSGGLIEKANFDAFLEAFGNVDAVLPSYGDHGTFAIFLRADIDNEDIINCLNHLMDYPCLDETKLYELEAEAQEEAWDDWVECDFVRALERKFHCDIDTTYDSKELKEYFNNEAELVGEYYNNEEGSSMWIDIDKVVKNVHNMPDFLKYEEN